MQVAEKLGATLDELREVHRATNAYSALSLDVPRHDVAGDADATVTVDDLVSLKGAVAELDDRERRILKLRFYEEATQSEIAAELGISQMQVSRLLTAILGRLRGHLGVHVPVREVTRARPAAQRPRRCPGVVADAVQQFHQDVAGRVNRTPPEFLPGPGGVHDGHPENRGPASPAGPGGRAPGT